MKNRLLLAPFLLGLTVINPVLNSAFADAKPTTPTTQTLTKFVSERMSVEVVGTGPDVILLPGFACSREVWRPLATSFALHYRVHLVQYAGFAGEPWQQKAGKYLQPLTDELARYIKESGLQSPALIGHSMGGMMSILLAQQHPELVGRVMSVDSLPFFPALMGAGITPEQAQVYGQQMADSLLATDDARFYSGQMATAVTMSRVPTMREQMVDWAVSSERSALAAALRDLVALDLRPGLAAMKTPVWAVYAADAEVGNAPAKATELWKREYASLPTVKFVCVENSRHFIMADQPEKLKETITEFLGAK